MRRNNFRQAAGRQWVGSSPSTAGGRLRKDVTQKREPPQGTPAVNSPTAQPYSPSILLSAYAYAPSEIARLAPIFDVATPMRFCGS